MQKGASEFREVRFIADTSIFPNAIYIYGNKVAMLNLNGDPTSIIIEDETLTQSYRIIFMLVWNSAMTK